VLEKTTRGGNMRTIEKDAQQEISEERPFSETFCNAQREKKPLFTFAGGGKRFEQKKGVEKVEVLGGRVPKKTTRKTKTTERV